MANSDAQSWRSGPEKMLQSVELEREGDVAAVPQQRHFENVHELSAGGVINPFRTGIVIPHFPEKSANKRACGERDYRPPIALAHVLQKVRSAKPAVERLQDQQEGNPDERITVFRPGQRQPKHGEAAEE